MGAIHQDPGDQALVGDGELEDPGEGVFRFPDGSRHRHIHGGLAGLCKGIGKADGVATAGVDDAVGADLRDIRRVDVLFNPVHGEGQAFHGHVAAGVVVQLTGDGDLFPLHHQGGVALGLGDAGVHALAGPHGGGDGDVLVGLGDAQIVVGVVVAVKGKGHGVLSVGEGLAVQHQAAVDDDFHLRVGGVGGVADLGGDLHRILLAQDGSHGVAVEVVADGQVVVLGGIHPVVADGVVDPLLGEVRGQDYGAGGVGVAPVAFVVVLVVGGGHVPALVQGPGVVLIAGEVAGGADGPFSVAHLNEGDALVHLGIVEGEVLEVAEGGAGVVELGEGAPHLHQLVVVVLIPFGGAGLVAELAVAAALKAGGVEGVDVAEAVGPGHLEAVEAYKVFARHGSGGLVPLLPLVADIGQVSPQIHAGITLVVEGVGVVGDRQEV